MGSHGDVIQVVGAGPAGLAAAITLARAGRKVLVHEAQRMVGNRFRRDFQGLENWSTTSDVLDEFQAIGITTAFAALPCFEGTGFDAWDKAYSIRSAAPVFYMVERGPGERSLDSALLAQALGAGVEVRFGSRVEHLDGTGILAAGPRAADAIAVGYHFETDLPDGFWLVLDDDVAPLGYAYLLVMGGRGTVKSCMFSAFRQQKQYVARTVERFRRLVGLRMRKARFHGGIASFRIPGAAVSGGQLVAGEQAGFQDAFAGFGMRYAIQSGVLAARSLIDGVSYDRAWRERLKPSIENSVVNRAVYRALGNLGYRWLLRTQEWSGNTRRFLHFLYRPGPLTGVLLPWARLRWEAGPRGDQDQACDRAALRSLKHLHRHFYG